MTDPATPSPTPPNQHLAQLIIAKLAAEGLIMPAKQAEVEASVAAGTASEEDWKLWVDMPLLKKESKA